MSEPLVSHGRGGAANIRKDATPYVDGAIVRQGPHGDQGNGAYSSGRGGRGNIGSPAVKPNNEEPGDRDVIPEEAVRFHDMVPNEAVRLGNTSDYHIGRGGEGNRRNSKNDAPQPQFVGGEQGLAEKLKSKLIRRKSENTEGKLAKDDESTQN